MKLSATLQNPAKPKYDLKETLDSCELLWNLCGGPAWATRGTK